MAQPALLILDEPCLGLDPVARERFLRFLQNLGRSSKPPTMVLVTHHVEEIMPVFSHVLIVKNGHILAGGERKTALTSKTLSSAFGEPLCLRRRKDRYQLELRSNSSNLM